MRRRLVVAIATVAAIAVVVFAVPLTVVLQRAHRDERILRLQRDTVAATRAIDVSAESGDPVELPDSPRALAVYDSRGRRLDGRGGPARADAAVREAISRQRLANRVSGDRVVVAVPLVVDERVTGAVRSETARLGAGGTTWALAGLAAAVIVLAIAGAVLLGRRLSRPMERLADAARRLGEGDFGSRAPHTGVPELDQIASALDATAARLDDLITRERAFSADASHQLRTPLAALRLELEALELRAGPTPELHAAISQVDRLQETVATLLAVARDLPRTTTSCDLRAVLDDVRSHWRGPLGKANRPLRITVPPGAGSAPIPEAVLREILDVLIDNAHRHGAGAVKVAVREVGEALAIDVSDEGPGLSGDPDAAFQRRSGTDKSHGIGLALARSLAHAEGAQLSVARAGPRPVFTLLVEAEASRQDT